MHEASVSRFADHVAYRFLGWCTALVAVTLSGSMLAAAPPGARPGSGKITVTSQPAGATIYLDGQASGKAPAEISGLGPGRYFLRAELDGYRAGEAVVEISSSQNSPAVAIDLISNTAPRRIEPAAPVVTAKPATPLPVPVAPAPMATPVPAPTAFIPARATPAPAPVPVAPPITPAAVPAAAVDSDEAIRGLVAAHLKAISDGDVDTYLRLCASKVDLYDEGMQSRDSIRRSRQKLKERWPVYEISNVREVAVRAVDGGVKRAAVTYDWTVSNPKTGKKASGTANDLLDFKQVGGQWLIVKARQNVDRKGSR